MSNPPTPAPEIHKNLQPPQRSVAIWGPLLAVTLIAVLATIIGWRYVMVHHELARTLKSESEVFVNVATVKRDDQAHVLVLPGSIQAFAEAKLYARTSGYIKAWHTDIGTKVKAGQLLAEIEAPDVDAQLRQATANLAQARASLEIARLNFTRQNDLRQKSVTSQQEYDQSRTNLEAQQAAVQAGEANLQNLQVQQSFQKITAPFAGTVTNRYVDIGALVSAGSSATGTTLFALQQTDPLRIYVYVPQSDARSIHEGMTAKVLLQELPGQDVEGTVVRTSGAIDPASRTLLTEVDVKNSDGKLYAGMYGQVKFALKSDFPLILLPANAFTFHSAGPQVAVVTKENTIHWQDVKVGRDFGASLELTSGLEENASVVINPTDDLREGTRVQVSPTKPR